MSTYHDHGINLDNAASGEHRVVCPQCSPHRHKSGEKCLAVNADKKTWLCHHCGWSGALGKKHEQEQPKTYQRPKHVHVDLSQELLEYCIGRGISRETLAANGICQGRLDKDSPSIKFPYYKAGVVVNAKHRTIDKRFRQESGAEQCLYRFDAISSMDSERVIITEGEFDALAAYEAGFHDATSVPNGAPAPNAKNYSREFLYLESAEAIFKAKKQVVLAVDNDAPGKILEQELARRIGVEKCWRVEYPEGCKDLNDVLVKHGPVKLSQIVHAAKPYPVEGIFTSGDIADLIVHLYEHGSQRGTPTGWRKLDQFYTVKTGQMTVITGIPGHGKSNFLDSLMVNLAKSHDWSFALFSPENWPLQRHAQSLIEKWTGKTFTTSSDRVERIQRECLNETIRAIDDKFYFIMPEERSLTMETILEKVRVAIFRHGIKGVAIDPWNEVEHDFGNLTETQYISNMLGMLRRFARLSDVHIWLVAHPQKLQKDKDTGKYKPPTMYEISGGAHWRNKADVGICIHRPDMERDEAQVIIQKIRFREVGRLGIVRFSYNRETGIYTDLLVEQGGDSINDSCAEDAPF